MPVPREPDPPIPATRELRVLVNPARPELHLDVFDRSLCLIKWRKITTDGLLHTNSGLVEHGPVTVPNIAHYRTQIRHGDLVVVAEE